MNRTAQRQLHFERLETRSLPSSVLLLLAVPNEAASHAAEVAANQQVVLQAVNAETTDPGRLTVSSLDLLRFIANNTTDAKRDSAPWTTPTEQACRTADEMMRLGDSDLRAMVITESLEA